MKLAKALKEKNRLVGELCRIKGIIQRENSRNERSTSTVDRAALWKQLDEVTTQLVTLKAAIFKANAGIYGTVVTMGELKSRAEWIKSISTVDGVVEQPNFRSENVTTTKWDAHIKQEGIDNLTVELQKKIAELQDVLDTYNATVEVII